MRKLVPLLIVFLAVSCARAPKQEAQPKTAAPAPQPPSIRVHAENKGYVYRYFEGEQKRLKTVTRIDKVPSAARQMVLVVPDDVEVPAGMVYVADLRQAASDGTYSYKVVSSLDLDRTLDSSRETAKSDAPVAAKAASTASKSASRTAKGGLDNQIIMFSTSWCGVCRQARRWFENKGIPFTERDVEKDSGARAQMMKLATQAGFPRDKLSGVPIIWVKGRMISGFNARAIERILHSKS